MDILGGIWASLTWPVVTLLIVLAYVAYMTWNFNTFKKQGIPGETAYPAFGTMLPMFTEGFWDYDKRMDQKYKHTKFMAEAFIRTPCLTSRDPEFLKEVFVKRTADFPTRFTLDSGDKYSDLMISNISNYDHWKMLRSIMSPAFTSGKLKRMMKQINDCAAQAVEHMSKHVENNSSLEMKEYAGSYTMDVIASTAFGLDINTKADHNNQFVKNAKDTFTKSLKNPLMMIAFFFPMLLPYLKSLKLSFLPKHIKDFFLSVTKETLERRKNEKGRSDFLGLMMSAHKDDHSEDKEELEKVEGVIPKPQRSLTEDELLSQSILFFLVGYDTTATTISFLAYNLAVFPEKQDKLIEEIDTVLGDKTDVNADDLHEMKYLDMCVNESLRLYPPSIRTDRKAVRDVVIQGIKIPKDSMVVAPIRMLHYDPATWPEPEEFIPERFTPEAVAKRHPFSYMPFGAGPRMCLATRLAILEVKLFTVRVLKKYRYERSPDTQVPLKMAKEGLLTSEKGIWLKLKPRHENTEE